MWHFWVSIETFLALTLGPVLCLDTLGVWSTWGGSVVDFLFVTAVHHAAVCVAPR